MLQVGGGLDLAQEPLGADDGGQLGPQHLERHLAVVLQVLGQVHRGHAARAELPLDAVAVGERRRRGGSVILCFPIFALSSVNQLSTTTTCPAPGAELTAASRTITNPESPGVRS